MSERSEAAFIKKTQEAQVNSFYRRLAGYLNHPEKGIDFDWKLPEGYVGEGFLVATHFVEQGQAFFESGIILKEDGKMDWQYRNSPAPLKMGFDMKREYMEDAERAVEAKRQELQGVKGVYRIIERRQVQV